ncbi:MAG TPA: histidine triad nucleotide-binding protein [bacterium]|nr:histidine triad nucleotide-binding protein [Candidatus Omnitrophota bacterium]HOJ61068.1 histidine triad nucleotide-binding protein [bacterium]HOL93324.1 histidine triad nucleotide-binding protein [bacterium]HPP01431.1 histidine triad nucleotide-binding protein [bacterium]HXK94410.1 histidine triad nucleotide-binding protein [bacterium]
MTADDCVFCKIVARTIPAALVYEDDSVIAFKDIKPEAPVHLLVVPKAHIPKIGDVPEDQQALVFHLFRTAHRMAQQFDIAEDGYRLVINSGDNGGQTVHHLHIHVLGGRFMRWPPG